MSLPRWRAGLRPAIYLAAYLFGAGLFALQTLGPASHARPASVARTVAELALAAIGVGAAVLGLYAVGALPMNRRRALPLWAWALLLLAAAGLVAAESWSGQ